MKKVSGILAILFAATALIAQAPAKSAEAPKIPLELLKNFYAADASQQRAQREIEAAQKDVQSANESWKQAVEAMQKVCGDKFQLHQDSVNADPVCVPKPPETPAAPEKK
jgi:hypothetical protein